MSTSDATSPSSFRELHAPDLEPVRAWLARRLDDGFHRLQEGDPRIFVETAWDTKDLRLRRAGLGLWVRGDGETPVAVCGPLEGAPGLATFRQSVRGGDPNALRAGPVGERLLALRGPRSLLCELELERRLRMLRVVAGSSACLSLEIEECRLAGHDTPLLRVRAAAADPEGASLLAEMETDCRLSPAEKGIASEAREILDLSSPAPVEMGTTPAEASMSAGEYAFAVLREQAVRMLRQEAGTCLGEDPEALHQMRVATRRMRAAIRLYQELLPARAISLESELRWLGRALGAVRDLDVQIEHLRREGEELPEEERGVPPLLRERLELARDRARQSLLRVLHSARYANFLERLIRVLRRGPGRRPARGRRPILQEAPALIRRRHRGCRRLARSLDGDSPDAALHRLRIEGKKLRYAMEFHRQLYGEPIEELIAQCKKLQDLLGDHQDAVVGQQQLKELSRGGLPPRVHFVAGRLLERRAARARTLRTRLEEVYSPLEGRAWKRLRWMMKARHP